MIELSIRKLLLLNLIPTIMTQTLTLGRHAVPGLYNEEIPSPSTFYTSVAPLIYELQIPKWNLSDFSLYNGSNCSSPLWTESSTCPVRFYLPEVQSRFSEYLFNAQPLVNTFETMNASPQMSDIQFECDILAKHFRDVYIDSPVFERYLEKLKKCSPIGDMEFYRKVANYKYNISDVYLNMKMGFANEVWMKVHDGRIDAGLWANALNTLHSLVFTNYYIEANRWKFALSDCQSSRIPTTILPPSLLADSLQDLFSVFDDNKSSLDPVISPVDVGNYYKAEIADCTYTNETFIVRILVPVIPSHQSYSLMKLKSVKFFDSKNKQICQLILSNNSPYVLFDNMEKIAYETECKPNELCHVPSAKSQGKINSCASAYLNRHYFNVVKYCKFACEEISPYHLGGEGRFHTPSVQQVQSDKFILTGSSGEIKNSSVVMIRCPGWPDKSINLLPYGAMEITLPCICKLYTSASVLLNGSGLAVRSPCDDSIKATVKLIHIVPLHWLNNLKLKEIRPKQGPAGDDVIFRFTESDLEFPEPVTSSAYVDRKSDATSTGVVLVLVLYFLLIVLMFLMVLFLSYRLKNMGVSMNPLKVIQGGQGVSYTNIGRKYENGLLSNDDSQCAGNDPYVQM